MRNAQGHEADVRHTGEYGVQVQWGGNGPMFTLYRAGRIWVGMDVIAPEPMQAVEGEAERGDGIS